MKQYLKIILFSCLVGGILSSIFFFHFKGSVEAKEKNTIYAFQIGVFKSLENANKMVEEYQSSKVIKMQEYYRVFIGVTINNMDIYKGKMDDLGITYYIKEIVVDDKIVEKVKKYDEIIKNSNASILDISKNVLKELPSEL